MSHDIARGSSGIKGESKVPLSVFGLEAYAASVGVEQLHDDVPLPTAL